MQFLSSELRLSQTEKAFSLVLAIVETVNCTWLLTMLLNAMHQNIMALEIQHTASYMYK